MKSNDIDITTAHIKLTAMGALDYDAIQTRARQLRREAFSALTDDLVRWLAHAWAVMTRDGLRDHVHMDIPPRETARITELQAAPIRVRTPSRDRGAVRVRGCCV